LLLLNFKASLLAPQKNKKSSKKREKERTLSRQSLLFASIHYHYVTT
jgi:hypothetical protein